MSETKKEKRVKAKVDVRKDENPIRLIGTLCVICAVCALMLGVVNQLTKDRIAEAKGGKNNSAMAEVLPYSGTYVQVDYSGSDSTVNSVYKAEGTGYVVQVSPAGSFSGTLTLMVGVNSDGTVSGISIVDSKETQGLGDNAKDPEWQAQFVGKSGSVNVVYDIGDINSISGATITSRAVCAGVNSALAAVAELG